MKWYFIFDSSLRRQQSQHTVTKAKKNLFFPFTLRQFSFVSYKRVLCVWGGGGLVVCVYTSTLSFHFCDHFRTTHLRYVFVFFYCSFLCLCLYVSLIQRNASIFCISLSSGSFFFCFSWKRSVLIIISDRGECMKYIECDVVKFLFVLLNSRKFQFRPA